MEKNSESNKRLLKPDTLFVLGGALTLVSVLQFMMTPVIILLGESFEVIDGLNVSLAGIAVANILSSSMMFVVGLGMLKGLYWTRTVYTVVGIFTMVFAYYAFGFHWSLLIPLLLTLLYLGAFYLGAVDQYFRELRKRGYHQNVLIDQSRDEIYKMSQERAERPLDDIRLERNKSTVSIGRFLLALAGVTCVGIAELWILFLPIFNRGLKAVDAEQATANSEWLVNLLIIGIMTIIPIGLLIAGIFMVSQKKWKLVLGIAKIVAGSISILFGLMLILVEKFDEAMPSQEVDVEFDMMMEGMASITIGLGILYIVFGIGVLVIKKKQNVVIEDR